MQFIINKEWGYWNNKDRVYILKKNAPSYDEAKYSDEIRHMCNAVIQTTCDWDINDEFAVVDSIASIQYRPKGIFSSSKGYFYKGNNKSRVYLTQEETEEMLDYMQRALKHLEENERI